MLTGRPPDRHWLRLTLGAVAPATPAQKPQKQQPLHRNPCNHKLPATAKLHLPNALGAALATAVFSSIKMFHCTWAAVQTPVEWSILANELSIKKFVVGGDRQVGGGWDHKCWSKIFGMGGWWRSLIIKGEVRQKRFIGSKFLSDPNY